MVDTSSGQRTTTADGLGCRPMNATATVATIRRHARPGVQPAGALQQKQPSLTLGHEDERVQAAEGSASPTWGVPRSVACVIQQQDTGKKTTYRERDAAERFAQWHADADARTQQQVLLAWHAWRDAWFATMMAHTATGRRPTDATIAAIERASEPEATPHLQGETIPTTEQHKMGRTDLRRDGTQPNSSQRRDRRRREQRQAMRDVAAQAHRDQTEEGRLADATTSALRSARAVPGQAEWLSAWRIDPQHRENSLGQSREVLPVQAASLPCRERWTNLEHADMPSRATSPAHRDDEDADVDGLGRLDSAPPPYDAADAIAASSCPPSDATAPWPMKTLPAGPPEAAASTPPDDVVIPVRAIPTEESPAAWPRSAPRGRRQRTAANMADDDTATTDESSAPPATAPLHARPPDANTSPRPVVAAAPVAACTGAGAQTEEGGGATALADGAPRHGRPPETAPGAPRTEAWPAEAAATAAPHGGTPGRGHSRPDAHTARQDATPLHARPPDTHDGPRRQHERRTHARHQRRHASDDTPPHRRPQSPCAIG